MKHQDFLELALSQAKIRRGFCAPNPSVGVVLVKNNEVIVSGYHEQAGAPHAEVMALQNISVADLENTILYVTLEPCCHQGRTPACTDLIINKGVKEVVYGFADPNPQVQGGGESALKHAGIRCQHVQLDSIDTFYKSYAHWWQTKMPWVTAKLALSKDGKIAGEGGRPVKITGDACHKLTHQYRQQSDAILTTANTIIADNSQFNVRRDNEATIKKSLYIIDTTIRTPLNSQIFTSAQTLTFLHGANIDVENKTALEHAGARCVTIPKKGDRLDLRLVLLQIGKEGVHDLWVEAGIQCFQALHELDLVQTSIIYQSAQELGSAALSGFSGMPRWLVQDRVIDWRMAGDDRFICLDKQK